MHSGITVFAEPSTTPYDGSDLDVFNARVLGDCKERNERWTESMAQD